MVYFQTKNNKFGSILECPGLEFFLYIYGIFHGHLGYFMAIWYILWPFGTFCGHLVHFFRVWLQGTIKIWQPCVAPD
jgi:hypothetical protein